MSQSGTAKKRTLHSSQDSPWKDLLGNYFKLFIAFFFANMYAEIDWERGYEQLDTELANLKKGNLTGKQLADKLIKVYLKTGKELWMLIHVEIQSTHQKRFAERMYVYNYMISHKYKHDVVSLAILSDSNKKFRPNKYEKGQWGCRLSFEFPMIKLIDYRGKEQELLQSDNPFALVVLAHLKNLEFRVGKNSEKRVGWKVELARLTKRKGYTEEQETKLFDFIDWVVALPDDLEQEFVKLIQADEETKKMPYINSVARAAIREAHEDGFEQGRLETALLLLTRKLDQPLPSEVENQVRELSGDKLLSLTVALLDFNNLSDLTNWLQQQ